MNRRLIFVGPDTSFSSWRVHWPAQGLMAEGEDVAVLGVGSKTTDIDIGPRDIVIVQITNQSVRSVTPDLQIDGVERFVAYVQRAGALCVLNLDDDYTAHRDIQTIDSSWYTPFIGDLSAGMRAANLVVVATPVLEAVYGRWARRITTVRNYPPESIWHTPLKEREFDVCWMGFIGTEADPMPHRRDFAEILPHLNALDVLTIGDKDNHAAMLTRAEAAGVFIDAGLCEHVPPQAQVVPYGKAPPLYQEMSRSILGLCPLAEHEFNRAKSWIKPLEFAIVGTLPVVPAWHPAYAELGEIVPLLVYDGLENLREIIDGALGASAKDQMALSGMIRGVSTDLTMELAGVKEWRRALEMLHY